MRQILRKTRWALARLAFLGYVSGSLVTLVGGFLTAPLMSWCFFNDWRFWRHWSTGRGMLPHGWRLLKLMRQDNRGFMLSVSLTSPPRSRPNPETAHLDRGWQPGSSCGSCTNCCHFGGHACPLLDQQSGLCLGYDSFYWRYFNCGRFPSVAEEVSYYDCRKWILIPCVSTVAAPQQQQGYGQPPSLHSAIGSSMKDRPPPGSSGIMGAEGSVEVSRASHERNASTAVS